MQANKTLLQKKYARVINEFADMAKISRIDALRFFYQSELYKEVSQGIADMHCRSDKYLAQELLDEYTN